MSVFIVLSTSLSFMNLEQNRLMFILQVFNVALYSIPLFNEMFTYNISLTSLISFHKRNILMLCLPEVQMGNPLCGCVFLF